MARRAQHATPPRHDAFSDCRAGRVQRVLDRAFFSFIASGRPDLLDRPRRPAAKCSCLLAVKPILSLDQRGPFDAPLDLLGPAGTFDDRSAVQVDDHLLGAALVRLMPRADAGILAIALPPAA
jgi:hypothetical protein